jgi:hypothetical protein
LPLSPLHVRPILDREMGIPEPDSVNALADREALFAYPHRSGIRN